MENKPVLWEHMFNFWFPNHKLNKQEVADAFDLTKELVTEEIDKEIIADLRNLKAQKENE